MENTKEEIKYIKEKLPLYLEGKTSKEDSALISEWIKNSDENYEDALQTHLYKLALDTEEVSNKIDTTKALHKVKNRIWRRKFFVYSQRIAAILFLPLLIMFIYQNKNKEVLDKDKKISKIIEVRTNPGMTTSFYLPDSTLVYLNSESVLCYSSSFEENKRSVQLDGEAFFDVAKDENKRFVVHTPFNADIEVYGTKFNIDAYHSNKKATTMLLEGKVGFAFEDQLSGLKEVKLSPFHKLEFDIEKRSCKMYKSDGRVETSWKDGHIILYHTKFREALRMLEKRYNVEFVVNNDKYDNDAYSGVFKRQRLDRIMDYLVISSDLKWKYLLDDDFEKQEKNRILIY